MTKRQYPSYNKISVISESGCLPKKYALKGKGAMKKRILLIILTVMMVMKPLTISASSQEVTDTKEAEETLLGEGEPVVEDTRSEEDVDTTEEATEDTAEEVTEDTADSTSIKEEPEPNAAIANAGIRSAAAAGLFTDDVEGFVERLYFICLGRNSDPKGKQEWVSQLKTGKKTAAETVWGFYGSSEYKNKNTTDSAFVESLYQVLMNRNPDATGKANWLSVLGNGASRLYVAKGFADSTEFANICRQYSVTKGSLTVTEGRDLNYKVTCFVQRLYQVCLSRKADTAGLNSWCRSIVKEGKSAVVVVRDFFDSNEYKSKSKSDAAYIEDLYKTMLNRSPDVTGKKNWAETLGNGVSRAYIIKGFAGATEFKNLCSSYGVTAGTITLTENRDQNYNVTKFVQRLYQTCLGRKADTSGLNNWTGKLNKGASSGADVVKGFFESEEYIGKNKSNENYVIDLYKALFDRNPDASGKAGWLSVLGSGGSRRSLLSGFTGSAEFKALCAKYGIKPGSILTEAEKRIQRHLDNIYASVGRDIKACYWWVVNNMSYNRVNGHLTPPSGYTRDQWYAVKAFEERKGNCYSYAAAFYWLAKELGYEVQYIEGQVTAARGGYTPHGWVNVKINGAWYICDPEGQAEIKGGYNFYMQPIGNTVLSYIW